MASDADRASAKRPRSQSPDAAEMPDSKRAALDTNVPSKSEAKGVPLSFNPEERARVCEIISREFSTEILLKHNELRLIDAEIAKCQVALEQLRRVKLVPYPFQTGQIHDMINVSSGAGPALISEGTLYPPTHPAPWGVTDGPYTRSYAEWLIPSPHFDGNLQYSPSRGSAGSRYLGGDRRGRGQVEEPVMLSGRSRAQRGSGGTRLQSLPLGYPQPKGNRGPLTLKRQSDGKWVKLVCRNCQREDFSSVQGFINHCRISHQVHFVTHEDAAQRSGTEEGVDQQSGEVLGASNTVLAPRAANATSSGSAGAAPPASTAGTGSDLVHKYNRYGVSPQSLFPPASEKPPSEASSFRRQREVQGPRPNSSMGPPISPAFVPSPSTPHLSSLFAKTGRAGNLDALVKDARTREDISGMTSPTLNDAFEPVSPTITVRPVSDRHQLKGALAAHSPSTKSAGRKGPGRLAPQASPGNSLRVVQHEFGVGTSNAKSNSPLDVSPSGMVDTNQAPSLVSDDGQSGSEGEYDEDRPGQPNHNELQARINNPDGEDELLAHDNGEATNAIGVEEKIRDWEQKGDPCSSKERPRSHL